MYLMRGKLNLEKEGGIELSICADISFKLQEDGKKYRILFKQCYDNEKEYEKLHF